MPQLIVVGIANTDRTRDLTPSRADMKNPDGTVQAVIRMLQPDGSWVRLVELLHVTLGNDPVISGAELLSAQHG